MITASISRQFSRISPETVDRVLGGLVLGFAAVGLLAFALFVLISLGIGSVRLVQFVGGL